MRIILNYFDDEDKDDDDDDDDNDDDDDYKDDEEEDDDDDDDACDCGKEVIQQQGKTFPVEPQPSQLLVENTNYQDQEKEDQNYYYQIKMKGGDDFS